MKAKINTTVINAKLTECTRCNRIVSKKELKYNAKFGGYGFKEICDRCADAIDAKQDSQQQDRS